ncbi:MAG: GTPase HflX, partial [Candidatus Binatia bacterium]
MSPDDNRERAVLVWAGRRRHEASRHLDELESLAVSAELDVTGRLIQELRRTSPATFIGSGKVDELTALATEVSANVVVFDEPLSPAQRRNIERRVDIKVIDRSQLILDIFARRAWTR